MAYCGPRGIPHRTFLGWPKHDKDAALWWLVYERQRCSCGTRRAEWDPAKGGHPGAYEAVITRCPGCAATEARQLDLEKLQKDGKAPSGAKVELRARELVETDAPREG